MNGKKGRNRTVRKDRVGFGLRGMLAILLSLSLLGLPLGSPGSVSAATIPLVSVAAAGTLPITAVSGTTPMVSERLGGSDRYATAAKISQAGWPGTAEYAVLAAGMDENLVDALTAAPLAAKLKAPILLTQGTELNTYAKAELTRLAVKTVYVTSGMAVITQPILDSLKEMQITVKLLGGKDRFETSVNMAQELENLGTAVNKIVVTTGANNADALSVASIAAAKGMPILLTNLSNLPPSVKTYLEGLKADVTNSYIIGGTGVVGDPVKGLLPGQVKRYAGQTRYDTNLEVLKNFASELKYQATYVANGEDASMADALAGSPLAAQNASPILLTKRELSSSALDYAKLNLSPKVVALGGEGVVPAKVLNDMTSCLDLAETGATKGGTDAAQPERITDNLKITADNVTLKNVTADYSIYVQGDKATLSQVKVKGTVFLDPGEQGTVNLDGVTAARVVVLSGANNSIHLKNVTTDALNVTSSSPVRVETSGTTSVTNTVVSSAAILDAVAGSFGKVEIGRAVVELRGNFTEAITVSGQASVKAAANANIPQMNIAPESKEQKITLQGVFQTVNINKAGEVALAENAKVTSTVVNSGAILNAASGSFGQVEIAKTITSGTPSGSATPGKPPVMPVVELRGTFDQKVLVSGQATVKAALNANIAKVEIAPESKEQKIILDGTFAKVEVNTEARVELSENAKVIDAVTNAKADFKVPEGAKVEKLDPKNTGTTASGGGDVNGTTTSRDSTTPPVVVTPPATPPPATGGGSSGGSGGQPGGTQVITVSSLTPMGLFVNQTNDLDFTVSVPDALVSASSSDTSVANASIDGNLVRVTATQEAGNAMITVTASKNGYTNGTSTFNVEVFPDKPAFFDLGAAKGSLYIDLSGFKDQYQNSITWDALTTTYGIDLQNSKVYLTSAQNTSSGVYATLEQLMTRKVTATDNSTPAPIVAALNASGTALHLTDADLVAMGAGTGAEVTSGGEKMFSGFNPANDNVVYASITGTRNSDTWTISDNCALPDLSSVMNPTQLTAVASDPTVTMATGNTTIDAADNSWVLSVTNGEVNSSVSTNDLTITGLPAGLTATAAKDTATNSMVVTVSGTASVAVTTSTSVSIVVKGSAVATPGMSEAAAVTVQLNPATPPTPSTQAWLNINGMPYTGLNSSSARAPEFTLDSSDNVTHINGYVDVDVRVKDASFDIAAFKLKYDSAKYTILDAWDTSSNPTNHFTPTLSTLSGPWQEATFTVNRSTTAPNDSSGASVLTVRISTNAEGTLPLKLVSAQAYTSSILPADVMAGSCSLELSSGGSPVAWAPEPVNSGLTLFTFTNHDNVVYVSNFYSHAPLTDGKILAGLSDNSTVDITASAVTDAYGGYFFDDYTGAAEYVFVKDGYGELNLGSSSWYWTHSISANMFMSNPHMINPTPADVTLQVSRDAVGSAWGTDPSQISTVFYDGNGQPIAGKNVYCTDVSADAMTLVIPHGLQLPPGTDFADYNIYLYQSGTLVGRVYFNLVPPDITAPVLQSAEVSGNTLTLTYDESLAGISVPVAGDFAVVVNSTTATVSDVAVSGTTVALTLAYAVSTGDTVTVSYTKGTNPVQDTAGNPAANLAGSTVNNNTLAPSAPPATVSVDASLATEDSTHFKTINAAVQAVADGGTIEVAVGTYPEMVKNYYTITNPDNTSQTVIKSFTLQGPDWTGQTTPLVHIQPTLSAIDPNLGYGHVLQAEAEGSSHPATVNVTNLWLDGSQGIASGDTVSGFIRGITLGYDVNGSITGNLVTGTGDGIYVLGAGSPTVPVSVTVNNNRVKQLAYDPSTVGSALVLLAAQATVSNNTFTGLSGAPLNGIKTFYTLQASITGNIFADFLAASTIANATYGGAMVSGNAEPLGYALNLTSSTTTDSVLTITGNTFTNVQGILADDRASGNLAYAAIAAANTLNGSWLAYGDKTRIHWLSDTLDPDQLNYVLLDSILTTQSTPTVYLSPGTYTMSQNLINPTMPVFFGTDNGSGVSLTIPNTFVPANIQAESGVTVTIAGG
ncbi:MAG: cell wall-binding repeat-containing protein [Desulfitobacteriaceae bacterium]